jgi:hypothetical protein
MSAKKKYFTINFIHLIHKACQTVPAFTNQCHFLHLPNIPILFSVIPQHIIVIPIQYIGPFMVTSGEMCCHTFMIHID